MNKKIPFIILALLLTLGFASCSKSDKEDELNPQESNENPQDSTQNPIASILPEGTFVGWTQGSNPYAGYIPSAPDSIVIEKNAIGGYDVAYLSTTHGKGRFIGVQVTKNDTAYIFKKRIIVGKNTDNSDFVFSQSPDTIAMPNRNPNGDNALVWKSYPSVLDGGYLTLDGKRWEFSFDVYCNIRYIHHCIVREGAIGNRRTFDLVSN